MMKSDPDVVAIWVVPGEFLTLDGKKLKKLYIGPNSDVKESTSSLIRADAL